MISPASMSCTTFCIVCFYQPAFCRVCVFILWTSCLLTNKKIKLNYLPSEVKLGCMLFRVKQYIPRPMRYFKCNRYGHVANHCRDKLRCSICSGEQKYSECSAAAQKRPNCDGSHSANEKICQRYQRETEILKLKTVANLSYAYASKELRTSRNPPVPHLASQSTFPLFQSRQWIELLQNLFQVPLRVRMLPVPQWIRKSPS